MLETLFKLSIAPSQHQESAHRPDRDFRIFVGRGPRFSKFVHDQWVYVRGSLVNITFKIPSLTYQSAFSFLHVCFHMSDSFIRSGESSGTKGTNIWFFFCMTPCMSSQMIFSGESTRTVCTR